MKTFFKILLGVIILGAIGYTMYFLYQKSQAKPIVSGIIDELYVEEGKMIKKGDLIARIRIIPNMISVNNAKSRIEVANINLKEAKSNYNRQLSLLEKGVIAKADFESYETAYKNALEELETANETLDLIQEGQIKNSGNQTNTLVRSTIDGMILDIPVEIGYQVIEANNFNAGTTIANIADMGEMVFEGNIDETEVGKIKEGMPLILVIGALENVEFEAMLEHISPKGVEVNGAVQFEIKADVQLREDQFIRAGYSANANIVLNKADSVLAISEGLLQFENDTVFVEVETAPQVFEKRYIKTGLSDGINIEVIEGLTKEDKIKKQA